MRINRCDRLLRGEHRDRLLRGGAHVLVAPVVTAIVLGSSLGCARTAEERQLDAMREDIDRIQNDRDFAAPPSEPPSGPIAGRMAGPGVAAAPSSVATPLPAYPSPSGNDVASPGRAEEIDGTEYADPEDTTPRPKIRIVGAPRAGRSRGEVDEIQQVGSEDATGTALDPEAKRAYDSALSLVNSRQFVPALDALTGFLVRWPDHPYVDHAMYWRGECYFAQSDYAHAIEEFEGVLARFPAGLKAPDALLKLAVCHQKLGQSAQARASFDRLLQDYPQSEAARHVRGTIAEDQR